MIHHSSPINIYDLTDYLMDSARLILSSEKPKFFNFHEHGGFNKNLYIFIKKNQVISLSDDVEIINYGPKSCKIFNGIEDPGKYIVIKYPKEIFNVALYKRDEIFGFDNRYYTPNSQVCFDEEPFILSKEAASDIKGFIKDCIKTSVELNLKIIPQYIKNLPEIRVAVVWRSTEIAMVKEIIFAVSKSYAKKINLFNDYSISKEKLELDYLNNSVFVRFPYLVRSCFMDDILKDELYLKYLNGLAEGNKDVIDEINKYNSIDLFSSGRIHKIITEESIKVKKEQPRTFFQKLMRIFR